MQQITSDMNKSKRKLFFNSAKFRLTKAVWQVTRCTEMCNVGSLRLIHGKTITLLANCLTPGRRRGFSITRLSRNGSPLGGVPFCGSTANVCGYTARLPPQRLTVFPFRSGSREERALV